MTKYYKNPLLCPIYCFNYIFSGKFSKFKLVDDTIVDSGDEQYVHKNVLTLTINNFSTEDEGTYICVSTNPVGRQEASIQVLGKHTIIHSRI